MHRCTLVHIVAPNGTPGISRCTLVCSSALLAKGANDAFSIAKKRHRSSCKAAIMFAHSGCPCNTSRLHTCCRRAPRDTPKEAMMLRLHRRAPRALSTRTMMPISYLQPPPPHHLMSPSSRLQHLQGLLLQHRRRPRPHSPKSLQPQPPSSLRLLHPAGPF